MNDFKVKLNGAKAVIKGKVFYKYTVKKDEAGNNVIIPAKEAERTVTITSGPGASPALLGRKLGVKYGDGSTDYISSHDLEYVIIDGKKVYPVEEAPTEVDNCSLPKGKGEIREVEKPIKVRRKR